jgi:pilus assembly protein Flp/PilA
MESAISHLSPESNRLASFLRDQAGATAIEYGLIAALISTVIIGAITVIGTTLTTTFNTVSTALANN